MYYEWRNDEAVRGNSFNAAPIDLETHTRWFMERVSRDNCRMFVMTLGGIPLGQVRFDIENRNATISISIVSGERGKAYGRKSIKMLSDYMLDKKYADKITAYVKKGNEGSVAAFKAAGYILAETDCAVNGKPAYKLEYTKGH